MRSKVIITFLFFLLDKQVKTWDMFYKAKMLNLWIILSVKCTDFIKDYFS